MRLEYTARRGVNGILFGLTESEVAAQVGEPKERTPVEALDWVPEDMKNEFSGMVISEYVNVYGDYVFQLTFVNDRLTDIKMLPGGGPVLFAGIDLFGPFEAVLQSLIEKFGPPLSGSTDLYFVDQGLLYSTEYRDYTVVTFTTGVTKKKDLEEGDFREMDADDVDFWTTPLTDDE